MIKPVHVLPFRHVDLQMKVKADASRSSDADCSVAILSPFFLSCHPFLVGFVERLNQRGSTQRQRALHDQLLLLLR